MEIEFIRYRPQSVLQPFIKFFYTIKTGHPNHAMQWFGNNPQGNMDMLIPLKGGIKMTTTQQEEILLDQSFIIGQMEGAFDIQFLPDSELVGVVYEAEVFYKLFHLSPADFTGVGIGVAEDMGPEFIHLVERMQQVPDEAGKIELLQQYIIGQFEQVGFQLEDFDRLVQFIRKQKGLIKVPDLAREANMSIRTLQRQMKDKLGISPKTYSQVIRFNYALTLLKQDRRYDYHDVLFHCGYFDQTHFIKEFKRFTRQTPDKFLRSPNALADFFLNIG